MPAQLVRALVVSAVAVLVPGPVMAERTSVQEVPCATGRELLLARDGTVSSCRLTAAAELMVGPAVGNGTIACAAGGHVEFHRNGYLSFCDSTVKAGSYVSRGRRSTSCAPRARVAFDDNGHLEYCF